MKEQLEQVVNVQDTIDSFREDLVSSKEYLGTVLKHNLNPFDYSWHGLWLEEALKDYGLDESQVNRMKMHSRNLGKSVSLFAYSKPLHGVQVCHATPDGAYLNYERRHR